MVAKKIQLIKKLEKILNALSEERINGILTAGHLIEIKKQLLQVVAQYNIDAKTLFFKLWQEPDEQLRFLASYLLPQFINTATDDNFRIVDEILLDLKSFRLTEVFSQNFATAIQSHYIEWLIYLSRLTSYEDIWSRCFLVQTLGYLADFKVIGIPYYLIILKKMMVVADETIQNCLSWALLHLYGRWPESVRAFIESFKSTQNTNTITIICGLALGTGLWIVPVLEHWLEIEDKQINETIKSTLLLLSKNINK